MSFITAHLPFQVLRCLLHPLIRLTTQRQQHFFILMRFAIVLIRTMSGNFCTSDLIDSGDRSNFKKTKANPPLTNINVLSPCIHSFYFCRHVDYSHVRILISINMYFCFPPTRLVSHLCVSSSLMSA